MDAVPNQRMIDTLSQRERLVLLLIVDGLKPVEIESELCRSHDTIQVHLRRIGAKLGTPRRALWVRGAVAAGLVRDSA
jgi:DNA-binding NarL/FixJ family response regulator